jgi:formamidopyrimidine-DNA glycosylase
MPELPEVETIVREMRDARLIGLRIEKAYVFWDRTISNPTPTSFCKNIAQQTIRDINRRGKFIVISLSKDTLLVHLRMTGKFIINEDDSSASSHERVRLCLNDGRLLHYEDQRKFGKWHLVNNPEVILQHIGLEPLSSDFNLEAFHKLLRGRNRQIKPFLLDQSRVAGLGNIYVDEALWAAKIHPLRTVERLTEKEIMLLHHSIIQVLKEGVENTGTSLGDARANYFSVSGRRGGHQHKLKVFRRDGLPCPRCQTIIKKIVVAQRGTHFCPHCQPAPI